MTTSESSRRLFLPGPTTHGHYQIELECGECHQAEFTTKDDFQEACVKCHAAELEEAHDSHPKTKFTDPRNADRVALLDARFCITCHTEHQPGQTGDMGLTLPEDYCFHCHQTIGEERPSHQGLAFDSCASSGCHNFHDNRSLYEDFLVKYADDPPFKPEPRRPLKKEDSSSTTEKLAIGSADAPAASKSAEHAKRWAESAHAASGVNCTGCHQRQGQTFSNEVPVETCKECHSRETEGWLSGHHGMRVALGLSPMTPGDARLPMKEDAAHRELSCASCHGDHGTESQKAATEACLGCHDDEHSRAYQSSKHFERWALEVEGKGPVGSGVSCATCHMPRQQNDDGEWFVNHNQDDNLRPNEKMVRTVCSNCHGVPFAIDALADAALVQRNFQGLPSKHIKSVDWAKARE